MFYQNNNFLLNLIDRTSSFLSTTKKVIPLYNDLKPAIKNINKVRKFITDNNLNSLFKKFSNINSTKVIETKKVEDVIESTPSTIRFFL